MVMWAIRVRHYSIRTEKAYVDWIKRFIRFHGCKHPNDLCESEVVAFLSHLAIYGKVAASTQNQALNALCFFYKYVLERPLGELNGAVRAKQSQKLPVVLSYADIAALLKNLEGVYWLIVCLLYGSGLRIMEAVRMRTKDLDFDHKAIIVRDGKGNKDRVVPLADELVLLLRRHLHSSHIKFRRRGVWQRF